MSVEVTIPSTEIVGVDEITVDGENPNQMTEKQRASLRDSIVSWGFIIPIVTNKDLLIADGEQRLEVAKGLGMKEVPIVRLPVEDVDRRLLRQVLNKLRGIHAPHLDAQEFRKLLDAGRGEDLKRLIGMSEAKLRNTLKLLHRPVKEDYVPPAEYKVETELGDLWQLGDHRILCGDSTIEQNVMILLEDERIDLVFTSPPYNVGKLYGEKSGDALPHREYMRLMKGVMELCYEYMKPGRFLAWNLGVSPPTKHFRQACMLENIGFKYFREIVWQKPGIVYPLFNHTLNNPLAGNYLPNYQHEIIWLFTKGDPEKRGSIEPDMTYQNDVWRINASLATKDIPTTGERKHLTDSKKQFHAKKIHPAVYPKEVVEGAIKFLSEPGDIVFDPFAGTGTNAIACEIHKRKAYMIEIMPLYVQVTLDRWEKFTKSKAARASRELVGGV